MKYVYCILGGGFNDQLNTIKLALDYCNKTSRSLIINKNLPLYNIDITKYFNLPINNVNKIIYEPNELQYIIYDNYFTIYLDIKKQDVIDMVNHKSKFGFERPFLTHKGIILCLPEYDVNETLIIFARAGGGDGYPLFKDLIFKPNIKQILHDRYNTLKKPYISIQIRNTDYKCNYELLYENNKEIIHSASDIHIATDDINALEFFVNKGLPIKNFTTFPSTKEYKNLHYSNIDPHTKFVDMLTDIYICGMSDKLLSSSSGGFIQLIRDCHKKKIELATQFDIVIAPDKIPVDNNPDVLVKIPNILDKIHYELVNLIDALDNI